MSTSRSPTSAAFAVLASIPIGTLVSAGLHLAAALGLLVVMLLAGAEHGGDAGVQVRRSDS